MAGSAAEARFGITIEGTNRSRPAFDEAGRSNRELIATVERLISVSKDQSAQTRFIADALRGASEEAKKMREESQRLAEAQAKQAKAEKRAADEARELAAAQKAARDNMIDWGAAIIATGTLLVAASNRAGDFQEKIDLIAEGTGLANKEVGGLIIGASNVGRTFEQISPSIDIFVRKLAEARKGVPEAVQAFRDAGVSNLTLPTGQILSQIGSGLNQIGDPAERSRIAFELFGRSFRSVSQIITQDLEALGEQAESTGLVFSGSMEQAAKDADSSGDRIKNALAALQNQISVGLAQNGGNALKEFFAGAAEGFATFLGLVNRSDEALGKFQIGIEKGKPVARFVPGTIATDSFYGDAYTKYTADYPGIGSSDKAYGPMPEAGTAAGATKEEAAAKKASAEATKEEAAAKKASAEETWKANYALKEFTEALTAITADPKAKFDVFDRNMAGAERELRQGYGPPQAVKAAEKSADETTKRILASIGSSFATFVSSALLGIQSLKSAFTSLTQSVLSMLIQAGVKAGLGSLIPGIGAFLQSGGTAIPHAQTGLVISGMRGQDTTLVAAGYGESVIDHSTTDQLRMLAPKLNELVARGGQGQSTVVNVSFGDGAFRIDASLNDPIAVREIVNDKLMPEIARAIRYGTARRAA